MFKVQKKNCDQCLFTKNRIVSMARMKEILSECKRKDTHFICHKGTVNKIDVCCHGFWKRFNYAFNMGRVMQRLGCVEEVEIK